MKRIDLFLMKIICFILITFKALRLGEGGSGIVLSPLLALFGVFLFFKDPLFRLPVPPLLDFVTLPPGDIFLVVLRQEIVLIIMTSI